MCNYGNICDFSLHFALIRKASTASIFNRVRRFGSPQMIKYQMTGSVIFQVFKSMETPLINIIKLTKYRLKTKFRLWGNAKYLCKQ